LKVNKYDEIVKIETIIEEEFEPKQIKELPDNI
jgi:hypothetical protein